MASIGGAPTTQLHGQDLGFDRAFDINDPCFSTDQFRMYEFKIKRCPRARPHDWTGCPFAHPGEKAKRRCPKRYRYSGTACPQFRREGSCVRGDACPYAHGIFECWLHPTRYRTQMCTDGPRCQRRVCFFAHLEGEVRLPEGNAPLLSAELQSSLAAEALALQSARLTSELDVGGGAAAPPPATAPLGCLLAAGVAGKPPLPPGSPPEASGSPRIGVGLYATTADAAPRPGFTLEDAARLAGLVGPSPRDPGGRAAPPHLAASRLAPGGRPLASALSLPAYHPGPLASQAQSLQAPHAAQSLGGACFPTDPTQLLAALRRLSTDALGLDALGRGAAEAGAPPPLQRAASEGLGGAGGCAFEGPGGGPAAFPWRAAREAAPGANDDAGEGSPGDGERSDGAGDAREHTPSRCPRLGAHVSHAASFDELLAELPRSASQVAMQRPRRRGV
ncbi:CGL112 [Auxenochlorella protothecoides x Auxenochlorella symbiontica]